MSLFLDSALFPGLFVNSKCSLVLGLYRKPHYLIIFDSMFGRGRPLPSNLGISLATLYEVYNKEINLLKQLWFEWHCTESVSMFERIDVYQVFWFIKSTRFYPLVYVFLSLSQVHFENYRVVVLHMLIYFYMFDFFLFQFY